MKNDKLYIIRGTGLALDGTLVHITEWGSDGYISILPHNSSVDIEPIKIMKKYLQDIGEPVEYEYSFLVLKYDKDSLVVDRTELSIPSIKNVATDSIVDWINTTLSPILKD